jgi:hypothetical protein
MPDPTPPLLEMKSANPIKTKAELRKPLSRRFVLQQAIVNRAGHELSHSKDFDYSPQGLGYGVTYQILREMTL